MIISFSLFYLFFYFVKDTVMALEALSEYELKKPRPDGNIKAEFTVPGRTEIVTLALQNKNDKVETDLKVS